MKEINLTPAQPSSEEKKNIAFKKLIDKGKQSGHLSTLSPLRPVSSDKFHNPNRQ